MVRAAPAPYEIGAQANMFERFSDHARNVMALANQRAQRLKREYIGTEHVLLGLVEDGAGVAADVLKSFGLDARKLNLEVEKLVAGGPEAHTLGKLPQTPRTKNVIRFAIEEARKLDHKYVGTEHVLLGLLREGDGMAVRVLTDLDIQLEKVRKEVLLVIGATAEATADTSRVDVEGSDADTRASGYLSGTCPHCGATVRWDLEGR
jgi:ATP-dependent Clp protease ATP-binding subunit ClpC